MARIQWERLAAIAVCIAVAAAGIRFGGRLILSFLLPFLLAWLLSLCITPVSDRVAGKLHLPPKLCAVIMLTLTLSLLVFLVGASVNRILRELQALLERLLRGGNFPGDAVSESFDYFEKLTSGIGFLKRMEAGERYAAFREYFNDTVSGVIGKAISSLSEQIPRMAGRLISAMPSVLLFIVVTVIAGFYFCMDRRGVEKAMAGLLPKRMRERLPVWRERARHLSWRYLRVYLLLLLLTFAELFFGLSVLRVEYAFLFSLLIAAVDILPVIGVGAVLVPWAAVELAGRNFVMGIGLLVLYFAVTVMRQVLEPKLVGQSLGLHPLLTLFAGYAGWKCFGVVGMAAGPVAALVLKSLVLQARQSNTPPN